VKKIDYYAVQSPWRMPKWVGVLLGGVFGTIAIGSMITIVQLTRPPAPPAPVATATPAAAETSKAAPVTTTAPVAKAAPAVAAADEPAAAPAPAKHARKSHKASKRAMKLASAKKAPGSSIDAQKRQTILAKHDSPAKRHEKDALDKLLGL
jgi:hypothetical protein